MLIVLLQVGLGLWSLSLLGRAVDGVTLLLLLHVAAFSLPLLYSRFKTQIDSQLGKVNGMVKVSIERMQVLAPCRGSCHGSPSH